MIDEVFKWLITELKATTSGAGFGMFLWFIYGMTKLWLDYQIQIKKLNIDSQGGRQSNNIECEQDGE